MGLGEIKMRAVSELGRGGRVAEKAGATLIAVCPGGDEERRASN